MKIFYLFLSFCFCSGYCQEEQTQEFVAPLEDSISSLVRGNSEFAFSLYNNLKKADGNLFFSPYSISSAMAIPFVGARKGTASQMQAALHYLPREENLDRAFAELNRRLTKPWLQGPNEVRLLIANALFIQRNFQLEADFMARIKRYFGPEVRPVDFMQNASGARLSINEWVREGTQGRIENIVSESDISPDTRLLVVSSIALKAVWQFPFDSSLTTSLSFFTDPRTTVSVPMMHLSKRLRLFQHPQFMLLELPYSGSPVATSRFDMLILLPNSIGGLAQVESLISSGAWIDWTRGLQEEDVILSLPRFKFTTALDVGASLKQIGMPVAFGHLADFTGIFSGGGLALNKVLHKAYISVDEKGTEAVAATAVSINMTSIQQEKPPVIFKADHPFVFVIVERTTGAIIFMGRYSVPKL